MGTAVWAVGLAHNLVWHWHVGQKFWPVLLHEGHRWGRPLVFLCHRQPTHVPASLRAGRTPTASLLHPSVQCGTEGVGQRAHLGV